MGTTRTIRVKDGTGTKVINEADKTDSDVIVGEEKSRPRRGRKAPERE